MKKFTKAERSTFPYWLAHWYAFNKVAFQLGIWKPKYLFHDIEKPWLMLFWKDYKRVQKWHRDHNTHHLQNKRNKFDWEAMFIDWECSRYTKIEAPMNALETYKYILNQCKEEQNYGAYAILQWNMIPIFGKVADKLPYKVEL